MANRTFKTRIATLVFTSLVFCIFAAYSFVSFNNRLHYAASASYAAQDPLEWIQSAQRICIEQRGGLCSTIDALLEATPEDDNSGRARVARQLDDPNTMLSGSSGYKYTIHTVTADDFEARATHHSGEDVWRIGRTGQATPVLQSEKRDGLPYERLTAILTIGLLLTYFGLLIDLAAFCWRRAPTRTKSIVHACLVFGVGVVALPATGGLAWTLISAFVALFFQ